MNAPKTIRKLTHKRTGYSVFGEAVKALNIDPYDLCAKLGYDRTSWRNWEKAGEMPEVAANAVRYFTCQVGSPVNPVIWIAYVTDPSHLTVLNTVAKGLGLNATTL